MCCLLTADVGNQTFTTFSDVINDSGQGRKKNKYVGQHTKKSDFRVFPHFALQIVFQRCQGIGLVGLNEPFNSKNPKNLFSHCHPLSLTLSLIMTQD